MCFTVSTCKQIYLVGTNSIEKMTLLNELESILDPIGNLNLCVTQHPHILCNSF